MTVWRKLHKEELHNFYSSIYVITVNKSQMRRAGYRRDEKYKLLIGKIEGKAPVARYGHILEGNIKMDLKAIGWEDVDQIYRAQDRDQWQALVNTVMNV
jgi:hypothetical protein